MAKVKHSSIVNELSGKVGNVNREWGKISDNQMEGRYMDDAWYKKIAVIYSRFKPGDSILEKYLSVHNEIEKDAYKICFKYRAVHRMSGLSQSPNYFKVYFDTEEQN
jgi:hypothetical protein